MEIPSARIVTLMYHRVAETDTNPWGICVSPKHFEEQIRFIKNHAAVITAEEMIRQVTQGNIPESSVCITFDDGYEDNYVNVLPILEKYHCPATFFIATAFTGSFLPFWWDELEMICLHSKQLPDCLQLSVNDATYDFNFETELTEDNRQKHLAWKWYEDLPSMRCHSFLAIWNLLRPLPYTEIKEQMNVIRVWANSHFHARLPMNQYQLQQLRVNDLSTIGLHTHSHPDLASLSEKAQTEDILAGIQTLSCQYETESRLLAYPYGRYNGTTLSAVEKLPIKACFTTEAVPVTIHSHPARLGRYQVFDWEQPEFQQQLFNWLGR